jgi:hypothetical protein
MRFAISNLDHHYLMVFANLGPQEKDAFFSLLDE